MKFGLTKIIIISPFVPYPITHGVKRRIYDIIYALYKYYDIHLICLTSDKNEKGIAELQKYCSVNLIKSFQSKSIFHKAIMKIIYFLGKYFAGLNIMDIYASFLFVREKEIRLIKSIYPKLIIINYFYSAKNIRVLRTIAPVIIDTHDWQFEKRYNNDILSSGVDKFLFKIYRYRIFQREIDILNQGDSIITVSDRDNFIFSTLLSHKKLKTNNFKIEFRKKDSKKIKINFYEQPKILKENFNKPIINNKVHTVYRGVNEEDFPRLYKFKNNKTIILYGVFHDNNENTAMAIIFFSKIYHLIHEKIPTLKVILVGTGSKEFLLKIGYNKNTSVKASGYCENIYRILLLGDVAVLPLTYTSGIRGRILELLFLGIPIVLWSEALKGMNIKSKLLYIAKDYNHFAKLIVNLLNNRSIQIPSEKEYKELVAKFSVKSCALKLKEIIDRYKDL